MSILITVLLMQIGIHILTTIGSKAINEVIWFLFSKLPNPQSQKAGSNNILRKEVIALNRDMSNTSAQDDFAKWAKIRRQHDKKKDEYDKNVREMQEFRASFDRVISILRWVATAGVRYLVQSWFRKQAMFWLPKGWVPYSVEWILSFPSAPLGSISINVWWIACASVIAMASQALIALRKLRAGEAKQVTTEKKEL